MKANELLNEIINNKDIITKPAPKVLYSNLGKNAVEFLIQFWIKDLDEEARIKSDIIGDIVKAFAAIGIKMPEKV